MKTDIAEGENRQALLRVNTGITEGENKQVTDREIRQTALLRVKTGGFTEGENRYY